MFEQIIAALVARGVRFVVVGGVAATIYGSARLTNHIDICYDPAPGNLEALVRLLRGGYLREVEPGLPFTLDVRALRTTPAITLTTDLGNIDLLDKVLGVGGYPDALAASELVRFDGLEFRALTLPALIAAKKATGRAKDREHLIELEALLALGQGVEADDPAQSALGPLVGASGGRGCDGASPRGAARTLGPGRDQMSHGMGHFTHLTAKPNRCQDLRLAQSGWRSSARASSNPRRRRPGAR
ncbi:MAG: nucleotidyltransferase [Gemmatimonadales bacterium]